jgi:hypothetical protein
MADSTIVLEIRYNNAVACKVTMVDVSLSMDNTWTVETAGALSANNGKWAQPLSTQFVDLKKNAGNDTVLHLTNINTSQVAVGQTGPGTHHGDGGQVPDLASVQWKVLSTS